MGDRPFLGETAQLRDSLPVSFETPSPSFSRPELSASSTPRGSYAQNLLGPRNSDIPTEPSASSPFLPDQPHIENEVPSAPYPSRSEKAGKRRKWVLAGVVLAAVALAVALPVALTRNKGGKSAASSSGPGTSSASASASGPKPTGVSGAAITGGDGSTITLADGTTFTYKNSFSGFWVDDPESPFRDDAQPNSWTPPLNTSWNWGTDRVYGVNLGGLFVLEPFIAPALFQKYPGVIDEWGLSIAMAGDTSSTGGLQAQLEQHYDTFITEQDMAEIAGAGINWIRLPVPFWAIETWQGEPFLAKVCWKYILRIFGWARKYGLRIYLDLHAVPGSQNGYNHSGKQGQVNWMNGFMGLANAQRTLDYIRIFTEFISQPEYRNVVPLFGVVNEALVSTIGQDEMKSFYLQVHTMMRNITGFGDGHGPYIAIHDGFIGTSNWAGFLPGSDRIVLDTHPYFAFDGQPNLDPLVTDDGVGEPGGIWPKQACQAWGPGMNTSQTGFGVTIAGEFSNAINDCGLFILGIGNNPTYKGDCTVFNDWQNWNSTFKAGLMNFALASMDATQNWWFWTWKIGNSSTSGTVEAPLWSYKLGLEQGWVPPDPRLSVGKCEQLGAAAPAFDGTYQPWATGGAGAGTIAPSATAAFPWPPTTLSGVSGIPYAALPTYTPTGTVQTLPPPTFSPVPTPAPTLDGWADPADTAGAQTPVAGCSYPNAWDSSGAVAPTAACGAPPAKRAVKMMADRDVAPHMRRQ
ncbi:glycoside hydrolase family 5 protein [Auriscalpium vulgare]|uniref:Glycoside hydrolase family 5 protein n=1 Tax=Auriscalpium vulgare TaxID=40419 RepID=A0ACB8R543_9AGAM|nr:glycoside hydrolase family 5 protein [Auriscalpium vulgare]